MNYNEIKESIASLTPDEQNELLLLVERTIATRTEHSGIKFPEIKESIVIETIGSHGASIRIDGVECNHAVYGFFVNDSGVTIDWCKFDEDGNVAIDGQYQCYKSGEDWDQKSVRKKYSGVKFSMVGAPNRELAKSR